MGKIYRDALTAIRKVSGGDPAWEIRDFGLVLHHLADVLFQRDELAKARELAEEAVAVYRRHPDWPLTCAFAKALPKAKNWCGCRPCAEDGAPDGA